MTQYEEVKLTIISLVNHFSITKDVSEKYGEDYSARTELETIGINAPIKAKMAKLFNKRMRRIVKKSWNPVGSMDTVELRTIGDTIVLACGQSGTTVDSGEPT